MKKQSVSEKKLKAWHKKYGGLSVEAERKINKLVEKFEQNSTLSENIINITKTADISPGTRFIREFNGKNHEVLVLEKGFKYNQKSYKSLSAIANEITNTRWNGKVFFGLKKGA